MKDTLRNILKGIGSILDIMPTCQGHRKRPRPRILTPEQIDEEAWAFMRGTFKREAKEPRAPEHHPKSDHSENEK